MDDPRHELNNAKVWLSHLLALRYLEDKKNTVLGLLSGQGPVHSVAFDSLVRVIQHLQGIVHNLHHTADAGLAACRPLWQELRDATGDLTLLDDVQMRVHRDQQGSEDTRSLRRAAFKRSPYSHKSTKFKGIFTMGDPPVLHRPQLEPLSDEVSIPAAV